MHNFIKIITKFASKHQSTLSVILVIIGVLFIGLLILPALFAKPIADDFLYFYKLSIKDIVDYIASFYVNETGRYAQGLSVGILFKLFGVNAVIVGPILEIIALAAVTTWVSYLTFTLLKVTNHKIRKSTIIGLLCSALILLSSPSLFDTLYWLTSSTVYVLSLIGFIFNIGLALYIIQLTQPRWWHYSLLAFSVFICQSFSEATSAIVIIFSGLLLMFLLLLHKVKNKITKKLIKTSFVVLSAAIAGFLAVYLSPGSRQRQARSDSQFDPQAMFIGTLRDVLDLGQIFSFGRFFIILGIGLVLAHYLPVLSRKAKALGIGISLLLITLPMYFTLAIATYSMGNYIPFRLYTIPFAFAAIGSVILIAILADWVINTFEKSKNSIRFRETLPIAGVIFLILGYILYLPVALDILRAEILRASLYDEREASITSQLNMNSSHIHITPAPIILEQSEAVDISYKDKQVPWFIDSFKHYYGISNKNITLSNEVPRGYCLIDQAPTWYGVETCTRQHSQ